MMNTLNFQLNFNCISTLFGLFIILICINRVGSVVSQKNGNSLKETLKDFASIADGLAGGLKTIAKAAQVISGEVDLGNGEECNFFCKNGATPKRRIGYVPEHNGCGAYGFKVDLSKLPLLEHCCTKHDRCYGQCGMEKEVCDLEFSQCLEKVCKRLLHTMGLNDQESEGCMMTVQLMYLTVLELGCQAYLDGQKEACICQIHSDDNRTERKAKRQTKSPRDLADTDQWRILEDLGRLQETLGQ